MIDLDHVALATPDAGALLDFVVGDLGGLVLFGGQGAGFRPMQICVGDADEGMTIELLEPWQVERNDFLARFLERSGPGPHHLTFKVDDLHEAMDRMRAAGYEPINVDESDPTWKEAFIHPRHAYGTVVQLAEAKSHFATRAEMLSWVHKHGPDANPQWWPDPPAPRGRQGILRRVVLITPSLEDTVAFFANLLDGTVRDHTLTQADVAWPGGGALRIVDDSSRPPGVVALEGDVDGTPIDRTIDGARFRFASR